MIQNKAVQVSEYPRDREILQEGTGKFYRKGPKLHASTACGNILEVWVTAVECNAEHALDRHNEAKQQEQNQSNSV